METENWKLIIDSGSTKALWALCCDGKVLAERCTAGLNPYYVSEEQIAAVARDEVLPMLGGSAVAELHFYGAGCTKGPKSDMVASALKTVFPGADVSVESDMLGACRALCGREAGIVCILGTGANSCLYDGEKIAANVPPLGYILGDEGSGAYLGKRLVADYLKGLLPADIASEFSKTYDLTVPEVLDKVYKQPNANRYLASFAPFLSQHIDNQHVVSLLTDAFTAFLNRNVLLYKRPDLKINFIGSVAFHFKHILQTTLAAHNLTLGNVAVQPVEGLAAYHRV